MYKNSPRNIGVMVQNKVAQFLRPTVYNYITLLTNQRQQGPCAENCWHTCVRMFHCDSSAVLLSSHDDISQSNISHKIHVVCTYDNSFQQDVHACTSQPQWQHSWSAASEKWHSAWVTPNKPTYEPQNLKQELYQNDWANKLTKTEENSKHILKILQNKI